MVMIFFLNVIPYYETVSTVLNGILWEDSSLLPIILEIFAGNGWKWQEMAGHGLKWTTMAGNIWKWLEMAANG